MTMTTEQLIEALREWATDDTFSITDAPTLMLDAADRLEQLQIDADNDGTAYRAVRAELQAVKELPPRRIIFR